MALKAHDPWPAGGDWQENLRALVDYGAAAYRGGRCDAIRFNLFNGYEVAEVRALMAIRHRGVPYTIVAVTMGPQEAVT